MRWLKFHYPKLLALGLVIILAYIIFSNPFAKELVSSLAGYGYISIFIAGVFLAFGFTAPFAVGFLVMANPSNLLLAGLVAGFGAAIADILIFKIIKFSFMKEFKRLENTRLLKEANYLIENKFGHKIKIYLMFIFAEFLISSPLPDELGVLILAGFTKIRPWIIFLSSLIFHIIGAVILLGI